MGIRFFLILVYGSFSLVLKAQTPAGKPRPDTSLLLFRALQGDVKAVLASLDTFADADLLPKDLAFKQKFVNRFVKGERPRPRPRDTALADLLEIYYRYWDDVLLQRKSITQADGWLQEAVGDYIWKKHYSSLDKVRDSVIGDFTAHTQTMFASKGTGIANGKTGPLYDLMVWENENTVHYQVKLPGTRTDVKVVFMEEIVSLGWEEYATFGIYYPGGWASAGQLNCVGTAYDKTTENFTVSYLKHEGQHFADYKVFPSLSGADLEYRAKLVELCYAKKNLYGLLVFFSMNASRSDRTHSHAYANACVMRDLSRQIFKKDLETDMKKWKSVSKVKIHRTARRLLRKNTSDLKAKGSEVKEFVE